MLPKEDAHTLLSQCLQDPSPEVRVWGLQGLSNIIFHPEKVSTGPWSITDMCRTLVALAVDQTLCRIQSPHPTQLAYKILRSLVIVWYQLAFRTLIPR